MSKLTIRPAVIDDAQSFLDMWSTLDTETEFLLFEPGEREVSLDEQRSKLANATGSDNVHILAAVDTDKSVLAGFAAGRRSALLRDRHNLEVIIALQQKYTGKGVGLKLLGQLEDWALSKQVHRMELAVMTNNHPAIKLYEKYGFKMEGTKTDGVRLKSGYVDLYLMAKIIS